LTADLYIVTIGDVGFVGDIGECGPGKKEQPEECVGAFHFKTVNSRDGRSVGA